MSSFQDDTPCIRGDIRAISSVLGCRPHRKAGDRFLEEKHLREGADRVADTNIGQTE